MKKFYLFLIAALFAMTAAAQSTNADTVVIKPTGAGTGSECSNIAYEIKTGLSRSRLSHMMDAETWMDSGKAAELGFSDLIRSFGKSSFFGFARSIFPLNPPSEYGSYV